jgi:DnaK suppressor protein
MTQPELNEYRVILQNKRAELAYRNRGRDDIAVEATADEMDHTQGAQERDLAVGTLNRDAILLRDVRTALARMEQGNFGICLNCEYDISPKRLAAVPWAALCIVCQEAQDSAAEESLEDAA